MYNKYILRRTWNVGNIQSIPDWIQAYRWKLWVNPWCYSALMTAPIMINCFPYFAIQRVVRNRHGAKLFIPFHESETETEVGK